MFKNLEWSGPAWYSHEKDENGFPTNIKLEYFHPLDLGSSGQTDWDGKDLIKIYPKLRKKYPKIGKEWVQGNIHSHHTMGAFFSGTDEQQCIDGANENFYYSLVVSTKPGKELHFGVAYPDQFGQVHIIEIDDIEIETIEEIDNEWKKEAKFIKKNKKPETIYTGYGNYIGKGGPGKQANLFNSQATIQNEANLTYEQKLMEKWEDHMDAISFNQSYGIHDEDENLTFEQFSQYDELMLEYERGRIKKKALMKKLKKIGVNEYGQPLS